jgi:hypothetical protein
MSDSINVLDRLIAAAAEMAIRVAKHFVNIVPPELLPAAISESYRIGITEEAWCDGAKILIESAFPLEMAIRVAKIFINIVPDELFMRAVLDSYTTGITEEAWCDGAKILIESAYPLEMAIRVGLPMRGIAPIKLLMRAVRDSFFDGIAEEAWCACATIRLKDQGFARDENIIWLTTDCIATIKLAGSPTIILAG